MCVCHLKPGGLLTQVGHVQFGYESVSNNAIFHSMGEIVTTYHCIKCEPVNDVVS